MKRLLLPLLAALALPTAVNAEIIRLQCGGDGTTILNEFSINENAGQATILIDDKIVKTREVFATSDLFIIEYEDPFGDFFKKEFQINRNDGSYIFKSFLKYDDIVDGAQGFDRSIEDKRRKEAEPIYGKSNCKKVKAKKKLF